MEVLLPVILVVLGLVAGFIGARVILRNREEQIMQQARHEAQNELAGSRTEIGVLTSRVQSHEQRIAEYAHELQLRSHRIDALTKELQSETERRASLEASAAAIPELKQAIVSREQELEGLRESLNVEIENRSQFESRAKRIPDMEKLLNSASNEMRDNHQRIADLRAQLAESQMALEQERKASEEKLALLKEAEAKLTETFNSISAQALQLNNQSFLALAKSTLEKFQETAKGDLEKRQQSISEIVKPVRESLDKVDVKIQELEKHRIGAYQSLHEQLRMLQETQKTLKDETTSLVRALRTPHRSGRWGEMQLQRVVEMAGMLDHCHFETQVSESSDEGLKRPDMLVKMPGNQSIIVDSKVPLQAYLDAMESKTEEERRSHLQAHARHVRNHLQSLSAKKYWAAFKSTPEFVVMFLFSDSVFYAALEADPGLIEDAIEQKVLIATPTTLVALLKSAGYGWRQQQFEEGAAEISRLGNDLYKRISTLTDHLTRLGDNLKRSVENYNRMLGSLEGSVLPGARKFKELGIASGDREIPDVPQIEIVPRVVQAPELLATSGDKPPKLDKSNVSLFE